MKKPNEEQDDVEKRIGKMEQIIERGERQRQKRAAMTSAEKRALKQKRRLNKEKNKAEPNY